MTGVNPAANEANEETPINDHVLGAKASKQYTTVRRMTERRASLRSTDGIWPLVFFAEVGGLTGDVEREESRGSEGDVGS